MNELEFWYNKQDWHNIPKGSFDGTLFSVRLPLPMDPARLDSYCAPYVSGYGSEARGIPSLGELAASGELTAGIGMHPEDPGVHNTLIDQISFINLMENDEGEIPELPIRTCYENGWWSASFRIGAIVPDVEESHLEHTRRADALLGLLGKPSCIMVSEHCRGAFRSVMAAGSGGLSYFLVYEYDEYVLVFRITDVVSSEYEIATLSVNSCIYYTRQLWEYEKEGKSVILVP